MDKKLDGNKEEREEESENHRLTINRSAELALLKAVELINEDYKGGKVNRNQVAIWAIQRFTDGLSDGEIKEIQAEHLDEFSALESILRRAKESGKLPPDLKAFVQKQMGFGEMPKKKSKKNLPQNIINDDIEASGE